MCAVMEDLKVSFVETVLLSISMFNTEEEITVEQLKPYWKVLEKMVQEEKVLSIGVSDLDKTKLAELYEWAKVRDFKCDESIVESLARDNVSLLRLPEG